MESDTGDIDMKSKEWLNYWDSRYEVGNIKFIDNRRNHPCRKFFADWVINSPQIKSILEAGPGEMVEYNLIVKERPDIKYSIIDVAKIFIKNCKKKYPSVRTYLIPLEELNLFKEKQFDCVFQTAVFEHSSDVIKAIKNFMYVGKTFHFVFFQWSFGGTLIPRYFPEKKLFSSKFNIRLIMREIEKYGDIEYATICMNETGELVPFDKFSERKKGYWRSGDYLMIHGKTK